MGDRIFGAALAIVLSVFVQFLLKNVFNLRLSHDTKFLEGITKRGRAWIEAPVTLALAFPLSPSVSLKKESNGDQGYEREEAPQKYKV
jgi:hypothetical protein